MKNTLKMVKSSWKMESVTEPFFNYDDNGLEVYFIVFMGEEARNKDLNEYVSKNKLVSQDDISDENYNNAGYRIVHINFRSVSEFYFSDNLSGLSVYEKSSAMTPGFYEDIDGRKDKVGYVIIGHDLFVSIKGGYFTEYFTSL